MTHHGVLQAQDDDFDPDYDEEDDDDIDDDEEEDEEKEEGAWEVGRSPRTGCGLTLDG